MKYTHQIMKNCHFLSLYIIYIIKSGLFDSASCQKDNLRQQATSIQGAWMMGNLTYHDNAYHSGAHRHLIRLQGGGMVKIHSLGFPRIGSKRELKIALEHYWQGKITQAALLHVSKGLRKTNWELQDSLDFTTIGDFSLYDQVLDATFLFGNFNSRGAKFAKSLINLSEIDAYFLLARGKISGDNQELHEECGCIEAGQMRKWFDTNYHYIVPELSSKSTFTLNPLKLLAQIDETNDIECPLKQGKKVTLIGPLTYLWLSQVLDKIDGMLSTVI
ncbi:Cobalamin-independent synthase, N-terminal domain [Thorsellia anophelis DSM 18579]|uniref:Cobalamin-independent synthase, N-terminal domain n=1 Tax=Thorsellia anophelis DSM 18579 TaxID=1123402 RepID=A0A1H9Z9P4_9GAMM|nr:Cobalamin-independent synthase, N-terminal domain [Thorsellia anophelis DSM 18579]